MPLLLALLLAYDPSTNPLNNNDWAFPLLEIIHISGFGVAIGTIAIVDLCLLGAGQGRWSSSRLVKETGTLTLIGLVMVLFSGPLILSTDPVMYYYNLGFRVKMVALALAIIFNYTIHRKVALSDPSPGAAKLAGSVSLLLWVSVIFGGIFIAFY